MIPNTILPTDMFSLDVEDAELEVLKSLDFAQAGFGVILIEADQHNMAKNQAVQTLLQQNGYIYYDNYERSDWFVNERFHEIYANVMVWYIPSCTKQSVEGSVCEWQRGLGPSCRQSISACITHTRILPLHTGISYKAF
jgi:hypothetical protein